MGDFRPGWGRACRSPPQFPKPHRSTNPTSQGWRGAVNGDHVRSVLGRRPILDARSEDRYRGENEEVDPRAGHIPTRPQRLLREEPDSRGQVPSSRIAAAPLPGDGGGGGGHSLSCIAGAESLHATTSWRCVSQGSRASSMRGPGAIGPTNPAPPVATGPYPGTAPPAVG